MGRRRRSILRFSVFSLAARSSGDHEATIVWYSKVVPRLIGGAIIAMIGGYFVDKREHNIQLNFSETNRIKPIRSGVTSIADSSLLYHIVSAQTSSFPHSPTSYAQPPIADPELPFPRSHRSSVSMSLQTHPITPHDETRLVMKVPLLCSIGHIGTWEYFPLFPDSPVQFSGPVLTVMRGACCRFASFLHRTLV